MNIDQEAERLTGIAQAEIDKSNGTMGAAERILQQTFGPDWNVILRYNLARMPNPIEVLVLDYTGPVNRS